MVCVSLMNKGNGESNKLSQLRPCKHQVAGHLFEEGKAGSLVDDSGHFYKPLQGGPRGRREHEFYEAIRLEREACAERRKASGSDYDDQSKCEQACSSSGRSTADEECSWHSVPFCIRNAVLLSVLPEYYGVLKAGGRMLLELEDVAQHYRRPSIIDIKVGYQTWYPNADPSYIQRCQIKDEQTTQATFGFKICGMQVYRACQRGYWRASKRWCKALQPEAVNKALLRFANNEAGLRPVDVYGGPNGAFAQLQQLAAWFQLQRDFQFYSSSVLIIYEGDATSAEDANVSIRLVDFAHTFPSQGQKDFNFLRGLLALSATLSSVLCLDYHDCLF
ncbi:Inositol polyphosphate multikinase IPK2 [Coccomyxa sp. Obi]|nr:Inositol polyphosphate multikinase IPK2 [Coccomyxa sp. Obi]